MTKHVRIENADPSPYKVEVQVWEKSTSIPNSAFGEVAPDTLVETISLDTPTNLANCYITSTRYLVVKEKQ